MYEWLKTKYPEVVCVEKKLQLLDQKSGQRSGLVVASQKEWPGFDPWSRPMVFLCFPLI